MLTVRRLPVNLNYFCIVYNNIKFKQIKRWLLFIYLYYTSIANIECHILRWTINIHYIIYRPVDMLNAMQFLLVNYVLLYRFSDWFVFAYTMIKRTNLRKKIIYNKCFSSFKYGSYSLLWLTFSVILCVVFICICWSTLLNIPSEGRW